MRQGFHHGIAGCPAVHRLGSIKSNFRYFTLHRGGVKGEKAYFRKELSLAQDSLPRDYTVVCSLWLKSADSV